MLKISILDTARCRRVVLEGRLVAPWTAELKRTCEQARMTLGERELIVDLCDMTAIGADGEKVLEELLRDGVRFRSSGTFTKHVLKQLTHDARPCSQEKQ